MNKIYIRGGTDMRLLSLLNEDFQYVPLNELYFGKKPVAKLKDKFDILYNWCRENRNKTPYREKCYLEFNKEVAKTFGMTDFRLVVEGAENTRCYTYNVNVDAKTIKKNTHMYLINSETGFKFNTMYAFRAAVFFPKGSFTTITSDQSFAILLHEIGHSFEAVVRFGACEVNRHIMEMATNAAPIYDTKYGNADTIDNITKFADSLLKDNVRMSNEDAYYQDDPNLQSNRNFRDMCLALSIVSRTIGAIMTGIGAGIKYLFGNTRAKEGSLVNKRYKRNEYFCDSFATMYGYGAAMAETNAAINMINDDSFICAYLDFMHLPGDVLNETTHPSDISRAKSCISHLRYELNNNNNLTAEDKKDIENDIKRVEKTIEKYMTTVADNRGDRVRMLAVKIVEKLFGERITNDLNKADYDFGIKLKGGK